MQNSILKSIFFVCGSVGVQGVEALVHKPNGVNLIPGSHKGAGENKLPGGDLHICTVAHCARPIHT